MGLFASNPPSLVPKGQQSAGSINQTASRLNAGSRAVKDTVAQSMFQSTGGALSSLQDQIDNIEKVLRSPIPQPDAYSVADPNGNLIAWIGFNIFNNIVYEGGWFEQLYVGGTDPTTAFLVASGTSLTITDALIVLNGAGGATITLDPSVPSFVLDDGSAFDVTISPLVSGVKVSATGIPRWSTSVQTHSVTIRNRNNLLNVQLSSNNSINDGRISVYDDLGTETFSVLGEDGSFTSSGSGSALSLALDAGASPTFNQFTIKANALGFIGMYCGGADSSALDYDVELVSGSPIARDASVAVIRKGSAKLSWLGSTGNTPGSAATLNNLGTLDLSNGHWGFGGNASPSYTIDAFGDANVNGVYRQGGTAGISAIVTTAKVTGAGVAGSMTFFGGILVAQSQAT